MSQKPNEARDTKRTLQAVHRIIDRYRPDRNADACMQEVCRVLDRDPRGAAASSREA